MDPTMALPVMAGLSIILLVVGLGARGRKEPSIEERLDRYATREVEALKDAKEGRGSAVSNLTARLNKRLAGKGSSEKIATQLASADLKIKVSEYVLLNVGTLVLFALLAYALFHSLILAVGGAALGFYAPRIYVGQRKAARQKAFNDQLGDAINLLVNALRSGYSLLQSLETASKELPPPISVEFARVVQEIGLGLNLEQALDNMLRRMQSDDLDMLITAVNVQHEVGGNLAQILETISHTIRERVRIKNEIKVLTAQQMITAYIISFLPIGLGLILYIINPNYVGMLFSEPCGWIQVGIGLTMIIVGYIIIRNIVNIEV